MASQNIVIEALDAILNHNFLPVHSTLSRIILGIQTVVTSLIVSNYKNHNLKSFRRQACIAIQGFSAGRYRCIHL